MIWVLAFVECAPMIPMINSAVEKSAEKITNFIINALINVKVGRIMSQLELTKISISLYYKDRRHVRLKVLE